MPTSKQKPEQSGLALFVATTTPTNPESKADPAYKAVGLLTSVGFTVNRGQNDAATFESGAWADTIDGTKSVAISVAGFYDHNLDDGQEMLRVASLQDDVEVYFWLGSTVVGTTACFGRASLDSFEGGVSGEKGAIQPFNVSLTTRGVVSPVTIA